MKKLENDDVKFWIEDGILHSIYKRPIEGTIENVKRLMLLRRRISNDQKQYWCCQFEGMKPFNKDAREYVEAHSKELLYALACVVNSHVSYFSLNIFQKKNTSDFPFQIFKNKKEAIIWLKEMKQKIENGVKEKSYA